VSADIVKARIFLQGSIRTAVFAVTAQYDLEFQALTGARGSRSSRSDWQETLIIPELFTRSTRRISETNSQCPEELVLQIHLTRFTSQCSRQ
jgi:hypothetical protein